MTSGLRPRVIVPRDQPESPFAAILAQLVSRVAGARAAALVDAEGETVDYAGRREPYAVRVAAAHWRIVLAELRLQPALSEMVSFVVRAEHASFVVHALPQGYAILLILLTQAGLVGCTRALVVCARLLAKEAGWSAPGRQAWYAVEVIADPLGRPSALRLGDSLESIEVLGRCANGLGWRERGWRVRAHAGVESLLVREPGGFWYADEPLDQLISLVVHQGSRESSPKLISQTR